MAIRFKTREEKERTLVKTAKVSLAFSNVGKLNALHLFINQYKKDTKAFIKLFWDMEKVPGLAPKEILDEVAKDSWLSKRALQCAAKQASGVVRGTRQKQKQRLAQIERFIKEGCFKKAKKLQKIYDDTSVSMPDLTNLNPELDSRFVKTNLEKENETSFDGWITLTNLGRKIKVVVPFKKHKHFNKMMTRGTLKKSILLCKYSADFRFEIQKIPLRTSGIVKGIDIGAKTVCSCSDGTSTKCDKHGWDLDKILKKMSTQQKGSKAFKRSQRHRTNHINWAINHFVDLSGTKTLNVEAIKDLRKGKKSSKYLNRWTYTDIFRKLEDSCVEAGVRYQRVSPTYTSQRCSVCGWTCKGNRKGKKFVCTKCCHEGDADMNASLNVSLDLPAISKEERLKHANVNGFYWYVSGQEPIVPAVQKNKPWNDLPLVL